MPKVVMDRDLAAKVTQEINTVTGQHLQKTFGDLEGAINVKLHETVYQQAIQDVREKHPGIDI